MGEGGGKADKGGGLSSFSPHLLPLLLALALPMLTTSHHAGLALLPLAFLASYRVRQLVYGRFFLAPLFAVLVSLLESAPLAQLSPATVLSPAVFLPALPLAVAVAAHYSAVSLSKTLGKAARRQIEAFANGVSQYLDRKCYQTRTWPSFLYMKSERVLIALACIVKIALAVAVLILLPITSGVPTDVVGCSSSGDATGRAESMAWVMFGVVCSTEILFHAAMFLSQNVKTSVADSFALPVLCPSYWQWYFVASYAPTKSIWLPVTVECVRIISVSFFRMQDKEDQVVSPLMSVVDLVHGLTVLFGTAFGACSFPLAMLHRLLSTGAIFVLGYIQQRWKKYKTWSRCTKKVACRMYVPVYHKDIECHEHKWMEGVALPKGGGPIKILNEKFKDCKATYVPEVVLERQETKPDFEDPTLSTFISFTRKTKMPGEWIVVDVPEEGGLLISEKEMNTGLEGQFRVLHPLLDSKGLMRYFGDFGGKPMFAAKKYKTDPGGGWQMDEPADIDKMEGAQKSAALNRHVRLLNPYFQDCLMQEKAAEFGRAFNRVENLPVRKVEVLRAVVIEVGTGTPLPQLYLCEQFLDDSVPFRKFNNNDYVPGQQAIQNTPNMLSLFSYFHSNKTLVMCDIQGKKYKFTDPQFHSSDPPFEDDGGFFDDEEEDVGRDWLHSDGGLELQKRVLVGFHKQQTLHSLCNRVWPDQMQEFNDQVDEWMQDEDFAKLLAQMEKSAKMYATYFNNLNPVMDASIGGPYVDADEELDKALKGKGPQMSFDGFDDKKRSMSMDAPQQ
mmetsp:Transcript_11877/g.27617  ORF Transcript_11877/g.27617 Transcript_11877/m.27617 type:complete len:785 (+) Transcript_11877:91-2445(+)